MGKPFNIKGVNPGTGRIVELLIVADSADAAKAKAEEAGLQWVVVTPEPPDPTSGAVDSPRADPPHR